MTRRILRTKLCDMLGIEYPIISAGMGPTLIGETTGAPVDLVVAVSEAGGMGVLGGAGFPLRPCGKRSGRSRRKPRSPTGWTSSFLKNSTWVAEWARKARRSFP